MPGDWGLAGTHVDKIPCIKIPHLVTIGFNGYNLAYATPIFDCIDAPKLAAVEFIDCYHQISEINPSSKWQIFLLQITHLSVDHSSWATWASTFEFESSFYLPFLKVTRLTLNLISRVEARDFCQRLGCNCNGEAHVVSSSMVLPSLVHLGFLIPDHISPLHREDLVNDLLINVPSLTKLRSIHHLPELHVSVRYHGDQHDISYSIST
jgi:hypothetical protein